MAKLTHDEIIRRLGSHGLRHRSITLSTEGDYLPTDVDWNNKDVPHRNHVHELIDDVPCVVERDLQAAISLQKVLGIHFPLVLVHYDTDDSHQTHFLSLFAWSMVTEHEFTEIAPNRTRATTTYTVAGTRFWMAFFPLIRVLLTVNYRKLMSEDIPMRERRGSLRRRGYRFRGDGQPRDMRSTVSVETDNVILPEEERRPLRTTVQLSQLSEQHWTIVGSDDHLGLQIRLERGRIVAYPRMCPHEGADLTEVSVRDGHVVCPWHGRHLPPLAALDQRPGSVARTPWHELSVLDGHLAVDALSETTRPGAPTPCPDP